MELIAWIASFSWPDMPQVGSLPVVTVWEDDHGLPKLLVDPVDQNGAVVPGTWELEGRSTERSIAHYVRVIP